jgi:hypothetical protein
MVWSLANNVSEYEYLMEKDVKYLYELYLIKMIANFDGIPPEKKDKK